MAAPMITSATLNKTAYAAGETMVLTVVGSDLDEAQFEVTVQLRNRASGQTSEPVTLSVSVDELQAVAADSTGRIWTQTNRTGDTFTLTATA